MNESWPKPEADFRATMTGGTIAADRLKEARVLVVDDHAFMRNLIERMLTDMGVGEVHLTSGAELALDIVRQEVIRLDLIVCDLRMPDKDGLAFVEALRKLPNPASAAMPVLILTGDATSANIALAIRLGIQGFVAKPVTAAVLGDHVLRALTAPATSARSGAPHDGAGPDALSTG